jgi:hypothetical protein
MVWELAAGGALAAGGFFGAAAWQIRRRNMQRWLPSYLRHWRHYQELRFDTETHLILCIADHYEPKGGRADVATGRRRVLTWAEQYPRQFGPFRDSDGRTPRHTFFFPVEEYEKEYLDALAELCRAGFGEVEIHLHHDRDTPERFEATLCGFKDLLANKHGLLSRHRATGSIKYGFIHGNWALCNARRDGRLCGVNNEIEILLNTGCYADFTYPSAPDSTQPAVINRIYYAKDRPGEPRSHEYPLPPDIPATDQALLMVQGPLLPNWHLRKWGIIPAIENGCLQGSQPPTMQRLHCWLQARIQAPQRPDWFFVKLHAHGAMEYDHPALLGPPMVQFHEELAALARNHPKFHYHYVTAREMVNLIHAAHAGHQGPITDALDWTLVRNQ